MKRRHVILGTLAILLTALVGVAGAQQLTPKQKILAGDAGFLGRLEVTLAVYATAGLQTYPATTGNTTNGSKVVTAIPSTAGWVIGQQATIGGIPDQPSYITSVDSASQITVSEAAQVTATGAERDGQAVSLDRGARDRLHVREARRRERGYLRASMGAVHRRLDERREYDLLRRGDGRRQDDGDRRGIDEPDHH